MQGQRVARRVRFQASTCFRMGSKLRCMRSTPTARMSTRLRFLVCLASTGVNTPGTMFSWNGRCHSQGAQSATAAGVWRPIFTG